jgi:tetratricopeptide (TPR) repeat protein
MNLNEIAAKIGDAWKAHVERDNKTAERNFQQLVTELEKMGSAEETLHHLVDAYYGLGLARRGIGDRAGAIEAFNKSLTLSDKTLLLVQGDNAQNNLQSEEDDRFMMLSKMVKQRLAEMGS